MTTIPLQNYGAEYDTETGEIVQRYRDVNLDPSNWTQKVDIVVRIPAEFVTFTDLTVQPAPVSEED